MVCKFNFQTRRFSNSRLSSPGQPRHQYSTRKIEQVIKEIKVVQDIRTLLRNSIDSVKLNILVFGPRVTPLSSEERTRNLQLKRIQIKEELERLGHNSKYAEELVDPSLGNMMMQEELLMREYDLIVALVGSPGTIMEAGFISKSPQLANKAQLFMDADHTDGAVAEGCRLAEELGAYFKEYSYPDDLTLCHLLSFVKERVAKAQKIRYLN